MSAAMQRRISGGALMGFRQLTARELYKWWRTSRWWIQVLVWLLIFGLLSIATVLSLNFAQRLASSYSTADQAEIKALLSGVGSVVVGGLPATASGFLAIAVVILTSGSFVNEQYLGISAWLLSKPVTRRAYVLAKIAPDALGYAVTMIAIPFTVVGVVMLVLYGVNISLGNFLLACCLLLVVLMYWHSLTLMLSIVTQSSQVALGVALGSAIVGPQALNIVSSLFPENILATLNRVMPWAGGSLIQPLVDKGITAVVADPLPLIATLVWIFFNYAIAVWAMERIEF